MLSTLPIPIPLLFILSFSITFSQPWKILLSIFVKIFSGKKLQLYSFPLKNSTS